MDRRAWFFVIALTVTLFFMNQYFFPVNQPPKVSVAPQIAEPPSAPLPVKESHDGEKFYVLENKFQQLVFSNCGGSLAEINLSLNNKDNPTSPVMPIAVDRSILVESPANARFPLFQYHTVEDGKTKEINEGQLGGYYPLFRRSIMGSRGGLSKAIPTKFYGLNILSDDGSLDDAVYQLKRFGKDFIEFELVQGHRRIVKTFSFPKESEKKPYCIDLTVRMEGDIKGLWITTGIPEVEIISDSFSPLLKYKPDTAGKAKVDQISLPKALTTLNSFHASWICNSNGFFGLILNPLSEILPGVRAEKIDGIKDPTRLSLIDTQNDLYPASKYPGYILELPLSAKPTTFRIYAGPLEDDILRMVDSAYTDPSTGTSPGYIGALSFQGWFTFISEPFAKFLFILMQFFHKITTSWGFSIILLTIVLRIMLYPLNAWSIKSTLRMQEIAPKMREIQEKYKKDPKRAQLEIMTLYRDKKVNPLTGCVPMLIQLPFLIGMFDLLKTTFDLRGVSFIPGWIDNLTAPDVLFSWNYPLPFFGTNFHLLPIILGLVMWIQQRMSVQKTKGPLTDQQKQQKMMGNIMTLVFAILFYHFPSGLNIYWLSSMALGILQQWMTNRKMQEERLANKFK